MDTKIVTRNLNFDTATRDAKSRYRVKFGNAEAFDVLRVICNYAEKSRVYETSSNNLPIGKDSIYFLANREGDSFEIIWLGGAAEFMKEI